MADPGGPDKDWAQDPAAGRDQMLGSVEWHVTFTTDILAASAGFTYMLRFPSRSQIVLLEARLHTVGESQTGFYICMYQRRYCLLEFGTVTCILQFGKLGG